MMRLISTLAAAILAGALTLAAPQAAMAQAALVPDGASTIKVDLKGSATQALSLPRGKSAIIDLPVDVRDVHVTNAAVADVALPYARRIYVMGISSGQTDAVFFDGAGRRILSLSIRVELDIGGLANSIAKVAPAAQVQAEAVNDKIILTGVVANIGEADKVVRVAGSYAGKTENVLNMLTISGKDQVLLKVRIVEMQRNVIKQFGVNTAAIINEAGNPQFIFSSTANFAVNGGVQGGLVLGAADNEGKRQAQGALQAFERVGLVRTLAEPNLTAVSGETAKFLAGGEFPVPISIDNNGQVAVSFKPFGVALNFSPIVLSDGKISLKISTEVSDISPNGAFTIGGGVGRPSLTIPAVVVRRAETSVEMTSGAQMMIAGLLKDDARQNIDGIPGLKDVAVLGTLFRSRDFLAGESELVVIVTPYIVSATAPGKLQTPADGLQISSDAETILMGKLNRAYKTTPPPGRTYQGPYGHVIE
jgi:pilus assembly protein CpaC